MHDILDRLYNTATGDEAAMLDDLQRRAGLVWSCSLCRWHNPTSDQACEQCCTHRHVDVISEDPERPSVCECGGELVPDGTRLVFDESAGTARVVLNCRQCCGMTEYGWALDDVDYRTVFGHEHGDEHGDE